MEAHELAPDFWRWTGWSESISHDIGCVYYRADRDVLLFDPLLPPEDPDGFWKALDRDVVPIEAHVHVLITAPSHTRSALAMVERYDGARVWAANSGKAEVEEHSVTVTDAVEPGDALPAGVLAFASGRPDEVMFWVPEHRALVVGNALLADDQGLSLCPERWLPDGVTHATLRAALQPVLELGVERVLVSHGEPILEGGAAALRSLAAG